MSLSMIVYLVGMALVFAGQRLFTDTTSTALTVAGVVGVVVGLALRLRTSGPESDGGARGRALVGQGIGVASLLLYALTTDTAVTTLGLTDETLDRWVGVFGALWPVTWLAGVLPALLIDQAVVESPRVVQKRRVAEAWNTGLIAAFGIALVFPLNYIAADTNERWDLAYFKTAQAGEATRNIVSGLQEPVDVRVFLPVSSDVAEEVEAYFQPLEGPKLRLQVLDHAAVPALAKQLNVRDNGYLALTVGELPDPADEDADVPTTKTLKLGKDMDEAGRVLKKLDQEFQKKLLEVTAGDRVAYVTVGHNEMNWKGSRTPAAKLGTFKRVLESQNFKVKELGLSQGLADAVPDDANVVLVLAPENRFLDEEVAALGAWLDRGGSLFIALNPEELRPKSEVVLDGADPLDTFMRERLGLFMGDGVLAAEASYLRTTNQLTDRLNVATDRFATHESTSVLSRNSQQLFFAAPGSGFLEEKAGGGGPKVTVTVRSMPDTWADLELDLRFDAEKEQKKIRPIAAVVTGEAKDAPAGEDGKKPEWKAMVVASGTAFSDVFLGQIPGNQQFVLSGMNWLIGEEEASGTVENEEDIKIQHSKEGQTGWFYSTTLGIPLVVLLLGVLRVRARKRGGAA